MKLTRAIALVAALALFAAACGDSGTTTTTTPPSGTETTAPATTQAGTDTTATPATTAGPDEGGGTLTVARFESFGGWVLDAAGAYGDYGAHLAVMEPLLRFAEDGESLEPGLAESWNYDPDGLMMTFTLQEGARFSNGDPVTADDIAFSLEVWRSGPNFGPSWDSIAAVTGDGREIMMELAYADNTILPIMASSVSGIMAKDFGGLTEDEFYNDPIGAGAFQVEEWSLDRIVLTPNEFFYDPERPKVDEVVLMTLADEQERQILFEAGDIHINELISSTQADQYDPNDLYIPKIHAVDHLGLNVLMPPFDDVLARQAVAYALDYEAIIAALGAQWFELPSGIMAPNIRGWAPPTEPYFRRDLAKAQDLIAQSAAAGGADAELIYDSGDAHMALLVQIIQANLADIGINVTLTGLETGAFLDRAYGVDSEMSVWGYGAITPDISDPMIWIASTGWLFSGFETDTLWEDWFNYAVAETEDEMHAVVTKIQDDAFQNAQAIALAQGPYMSAVNQNLAGYWQAPWPLSYWDTISIGG
jgi:peptide/nickel transport system substrate-binding protein